MSIEKIRDDIKNIDERMLDLIAKRMDLIDMMLEEKKKYNLEIYDEEQIDIVLKRAMEKAMELNMDTGAVKEIFKILIKMSMNRQNELSGRDTNLP